MHRVNGLTTHVTAGKADDAEATSYRERVQTMDKWMSADRFKNVARPFSR